MTRTHKPSVQTLTLFASHYFPHEMPHIIYDDIKSFGHADIRYNKIVLNNHIPQQLPETICMVGGVTYTPKERLTFHMGEQYFFVLLHEIGHFTITKKVPEEFYYYKHKAFNQLKQYEHGLSFMPVYDKKAWVARHLNTIIDLADLRKNPHESWAMFKKRKLDFISWLLDDYNKCHIAVHNWAIREFKKQRETIREVLTMQEMFSRKQLATAEVSFAE